MKAILYLGFFLAVHRATAQPIHPQKQTNQAFAARTWQVGINDGYGPGQPELGINYLFGRGPSSR